MASTSKSATLAFGVVTAPVKLKKVEEKKAVEFRKASPAGNAIKMVNVDTATGEIVATEDVRKGIFQGDTFHEVPAEAIKAIDESVAIQDIVIDAFIDLGEVPFERAVGAYFLAPDTKAGLAAAKPVALLRDALEASGTAGIGKLTLRTRQQPFVVYAQDGGLLVNTLLFAEQFTQVTEAAECLEGITSDEKSLNLATVLVEQMKADREALDSYTDEATPMKSELVEAALAGQTIEAPEKPEAAPAVDLEAALLASIGGAPEADAPAKPKAKDKKKKAA